MNREANSRLDQEHIRERMLRRIIELWGIPNPDLVDPVIRLLTDAMAYELEGVGQALTHSDQKIMESLATLLLPGPWLCPRPYHALAYAQPIENNWQLHPENLFFAPSRQFDVTGEEEIFDVYFAPLGTVPLVRGNLQLILDARGGFVVENGHRNQAFTSFRGGLCSDQSLWLGLHFAEGLSGVEELQFHIQLPANYEALSSCLNQTVWDLTRHGPLEVDFSTFLPTPEDPKTSFYAGLSEGADFLLQDIERLYHGQFLSLTAPGNETFSALQKGNLPEAMRQELAPFAEEYALDEIVWLKVDFPALFPPQVIQEISFQMNVFPVVCRRIFEGQTRGKPNQQILPLPVTSHFHFLGMESVMDSQGKELKQRSLTQMGHREGSWYVHKGALERFDQQEVISQISRLLRIVREEGAFMSALGQDLTLTNLKNLQKEVENFQKRLDRTRIAQHRDLNYLIVHPYPDSEGLEYTWWGIMGPEANTLSAGTLLQQYKDLSIAPGSSRLITRPVGGQPAPEGDEKVRNLRFGLLTRNRIVSREDIRQFLFFSLGTKISSIDFRNGVAVSKEPQKGLIRTLEIHLTPTDPSPRAMAEFTALLPGLEKQLNDRSIQTVAYRLQLLSHNQPQTTNRQP